MIAYFSGKLNTDYASRPVTVADIDESDTIKKVVFIFKSNNAFSSRIEFRGNDSIIFEISAFYGERYFGDTLVLEKERKVN